MIGNHNMHGHGHAGTGHGSNARGIFWALLLTGGFMFAEVIGGVISGSLARKNHRGGRKGDWSFCFTNC